MIENYASRVKSTVKFKVKNTYKIILLYLNTIKYLKIYQIIYLLKYRLYKSKKIINLSHTLKFNGLNNKWVSSIPKKTSMLSKNKFNFLNQTLKISLEKDWDNTRIEKLWLYNLHYFDDLNSSTFKEKKDWHSYYINKWIDNFNNLYGISWDPYPMSLRIVNWIKWSLNGGEYDLRFLDYLVAQVRFLSRNLEYHIMGNHLFANAKALIFAGLVFEGKEAENWFNKGRNIFNKEIREQILRDGANFELSTMYHSIFLEDILDIINLFNVYGIPISNELKNKVNKMLFWLDAMSHPDGNISFFNDSALSISPSINELYAYSQRLGFKNIKNISKVVDFKESGYSIISSKDFKAIIDRGDVGASYQPGHVHADTLSFECSLFNKRLIVNSGISTYENNKERFLNRSTKSHSTVVIDDKNSSEVWSSFRVGKRAKIFNRSEIKKNKLGVELSACHNGYIHLPGHPIHCRNWSLLKNQLLIEDKIIGHGTHKIDILYIIHPDIGIRRTKKSILEFDVLNKKCKLEFEGNGEISCKDSLYNLSFNNSKINKKIIYKVNQPLPVKIRTRISW